LHHGKKALNTEAKIYFSSLFKEATENKIFEQFESLRLYPRIVTEEYLEVLEKPVSET
jgi:hypothetical protein